MILKTELNSKNRITTINTLAISVITYSFNIIEWNLSEVKRLGIKIIHSLYLPRSNGGRGLTQLKLSYKTSTIGLFRYLNLSDKWMLELALKHEKEKVSHSVIKEAREFAREIDLDLET